MKFFGLEINRAVDEKMKSAMSPGWSRGMQWVGGNDFGAMVKAYRSWIYVCANKNAVTVSKHMLGLYAAKPIGNTAKILAPHKTLSFDQKKHLKSITQIKNLTSVRKSDEIIEVVEHPFLEILNRANPFMSGTELIEMTVLFLELTGNAYWYIVRDKQFGIPIQVWVVPSQFMKVVPGKDTLLAGYVYKEHMNEVPFEVDEIVHFKYPNPNDFFYGVSPLLAVSDAYNTNENIHVFTNALFTNMARPEGVIQTDQDLSSDDFDSLKKRWQAAYGGASKARKTAVLSKGLKYQPITMTPQELDFAQGRAIVKEEICNAFGQSVALYSEKANRANSEQAYNSFLRDAVSPRLRRIEETINAFIMPLFDPNIFVAFENAVPEDKDFRLKERESNLKNGYSCINEERRIDGRDDVEWGDKPILQQNMVQLGSGQSNPAREEDDVMEDEQDQKFVVREFIKRLKKHV